MKRHHKKQIDKIFKAEYKKALEVAEEEEFHRQLKAVKVRAQAKAKKRVTQGKTYHTKKIASKAQQATKKIQQSRKKHGKRLKNISSNIDRLNSEILGL